MDETDVIRVERRIAAPAATVFGYLTRPELWARWQGEWADLDPRPGGRFVVRMATGQVVAGEYREVVRDSRVVVTWGWEGHARMPPGVSTLELDLVPDGDETILRLTHSGIPRDDLPIHRQGWDVFVPRLVAAATGEDPGPTPT